MEVYEALKAGQEFHYVIVVTKVDKTPKTEDYIVNHLDYIRGVLSQIGFIKNDTNSPISLPTIIPTSARRKTRYGADAVYRVIADAFDECDLNYTLPVDVISSWKSRAHMEE